MQSLSTRGFAAERFGVREWRAQHHTASAVALVGGEIERHCVPEYEAQKLLREAAARLTLSARAFHRVLKVARTIADLAGTAHMLAAHVAEALQYRLPASPIPSWPHNDRQQDSRFFDGLPRQVP